jgi:hypothetical protein
MDLEAERCEKYDRVLRRWGRESDDHAPTGLIDELMKAFMLSRDATLYWRRRHPERCASGIHAQKR